MCLHQITYVAQRIVGLMATQEYFLCNSQKVVLGLGFLYCQVVHFACQFMFVMSPAAPGETHGAAVVFLSGDLYFKITLPKAQEIINNILELRTR